jgi:hypothetical protein
MSGSPARSAARWSSSASERPTSPRGPASCLTAPTGRRRDDHRVYDLVKKGRVSVHTQLHRHAAQTDADDLEIAAMVRNYEDDPRPYAERRTEARARFLAGETAR